MNSATPEQLRTLPGVGDVLAKRIVEERAKKPFAKIEDLRRVPRLGPKTLEQLRGKVSFGEPAGTAPRP